MRAPTCLYAVLALSLAVATDAVSFTVPDRGALAPLERTLPSVVPGGDSARQAFLLATHPGVAQLAAEGGGPWQVDFDTASGRLRRAYGPGIPLLPPEGGQLPGSGEPSRSELDRLARCFLLLHISLLAGEPDQWFVDHERSGLFAGRRLRAIRLVRQFGGVPVDGAQILLVLSRGRVIYINATGVGALIADGAPVLDESATWETIERSAQGHGLSLASAQPIHAPEMILLGRQVAPGKLPFYRLSRRYTFRLPPGLETWSATVDARTGELLELIDTNRYATRRRSAEETSDARGRAVSSSAPAVGPGGSVAGPACGPGPLGRQLLGHVRGGIHHELGSDPEEVRGLPYVLADEDGRPIESDDAGFFVYSGGDAGSELQGAHARIECVSCTLQPVATTSAGNGILDFGLGSASSTASSRTTFYQLGFAGSLASKWLDAPWLDSPLRARVDLPSSCNAFFDGGVSFMLAGGPCANTGESRDTVVHEWGHWLDLKDMTGAGERALGEAMADHVALLASRDSCVGEGFAGGLDAGSYCVDLPGCIRTATCDGVRNLDELRARTGLLTASNALSACPTAGECRGPLGRECHCEGSIYGQAAFHLAMNLLTGRDYANGVPLGADNDAYSPTAAWDHQERLFFSAVDLMDSYLPSRLQSLGTSAYDAYLLVDDDDGDLTNGTPNAAYINAAFHHHEIAEAPLVGDTPNCLAPADPLLSAKAEIGECSGNPGVTLSWDDVSASSYDVYRSYRLKDAWLPVATGIVDDGRAVYEVRDDPVAAGETLHYVVVARAVDGCPSPGVEIRSIVVAVADPGTALAGVRDLPPGGDGDGVAEPGETVSLLIDLEERASYAGLTAVSVGLTTKDPLARVTGPGPIAYGTLVPGGRLVAPGGFEVRIDATHGCGSYVTLVVEITGAEGTMLRPLRLPLGCQL